MSTPDHKKNNPLKLPVNLEAEMERIVFPYLKAAWIEGFNAAAQLSAKGDSVPNPEYHWLSSKTHLDAGGIYWEVRPPNYQPLHQSP